MEREIEFNPKTMKRATKDDISRIWLQLWGTKKDGAMTEKILPHRAKMFDICYAEMSPQSQQALDDMIAWISDLVGGDMSAKELIIQLIRFWDAAKTNAALLPDGAETIKEK